METSIQDTRAELESLVNGLFGLTVKEALSRELWNLEYKELVKKIDHLTERVGTKDIYGNGMAALELSKQYGWRLVKPDRVRGQYFGMIVALEFHLAIVRLAQNNMMELPFGSMATTEERSPQIGDSVHMAFRDGVLTATVTPKGHW